MALEPKHNNTCLFYNYQGKETDLLIAFSVIKWLYYPHSVTKKIRTTLFPDFVIAYPKNPHQIV